MKVKKLSVLGYRIYRFSGYAKDLVRVYRNDYIILQEEFSKADSDESIKMQCIESCSGIIQKDIGIKKVNENQLRLFLEKGDQSYWEK